MYSHCIQFYDWSACIGVASMHVYFPLLYDNSITKYICYHIVGMFAWHGEAMENLINYP